MTCPLCRGPTKNRLLVNADEHLAAFDGRRFSLTHSEYVVLEAINDAWPRIARRDFILERLYPLEQDAPLYANKNIDMHVFRIRRKAAKFDFEIETIWREGYRLEQEAEEAVIRN